MFSVVVAVQRYRVEASRRVTICCNSFRLVSVISRNSLAQLSRRDLFGIRCVEMFLSVPVAVEGLKSRSGLRTDYALNTLRHVAEVTLLSKHCRGGSPLR